jgi:outer membrane lipoprotein SlyB
MDTAKAGHLVREAVAVFHDRDSFLSAVDDLMSAGFDRAELSLVASERAVEEKLGHAYEKVQELEDDPNVPRIAYVGDHSLAEGKTGIIGGLAYIGAMAAAGAVVASGGSLAAVIAATAVAGGGGGLLGSWAARFLGRERATELQHQLDHGGLLLWVRARDEAHEKRAVEILTRNSGDDVHVHELPGSRDPAANPLTGVEFDPFLPGARV